MIQQEKGTEIWLRLRKIEIFSRFIFHGLSDLYANTRITWNLKDSSSLSWNIVKVNVCRIHRMRSEAMNMFAWLDHAKLW